MDSKLKTPRCSVHNEAFILEIAEEMFLERGYDGVSTTEIAQKAGVNHALIHYYYRTKKNLFTKILIKNIETFSQSLVSVANSNLPLTEKIRVEVETHFNFLMEKPRIPNFIFAEINKTSENMELFKNVFNPVFKEVCKSLDLALQIEIEKGNIRPTKASDLILSMISLNAFFFIGQLFYQECSSVKLQETALQRREENVRIILQSLSKNQ